MKRLLSYIMLFALAAIPYGCERESIIPDIPAPQRENVAIRFKTAPLEDWTPTKGESDIHKVTTASMGTSGFGVYAYYTGEEPFDGIHNVNDATYERYGMVFMNRPFYFQDGVWVDKYNGTEDSKPEIWPSGENEKLTFFAYAPYDLWHSAVDTSGTVPTITYDCVAADLSVSELETRQKDILWGTNSAGLAYKNVNKDSFDEEGVVDMHFRHALAKVNFTATTSLGATTRLSTVNTSGAHTDNVGSPQVTDLEGTVEDLSPEYTFSAGNEYSEGTGWQTRYYKDYTCYKTYKQRLTWTRVSVQKQEQTGATGTYVTEGKRYYIESAEFKGFNTGGTLVLDNTDGFYPTWTGIPAAKRNYSLNCLPTTNVLNDSLRYVASAATLQGNPGLYTGLGARPMDLMSGRYLYAVPHVAASASDRIKVNLKYHIANVSGTESAPVKRAATETTTRQITKTRTYTVTSTNTVKVQRNNGRYTTPSSDQFSFDDYSFPEGGWDGIDEIPGTASATPVYEDWVKDGSSTPVSFTANYDDDTSPEVEGDILSDLNGGRAYTVNLVISGDKMELDVVTQPWDLAEYSLLYDTRINGVSQYLTYENADRGDSRGNVYVNNRITRFYFKLGPGMYSLWRARIIGNGASGNGAGAFAFCDAEGNYYPDAGEEDGRSRTLVHAINPDETYNIYVRAVNTEAGVYSSAKLRIYYEDDDNNTTVALNLVNLNGVVEYTLVQE